MNRRRPLIVVAALASLSGCGGSGSAQRVTAPSIQTADCRIWRVLDAEHRKALLGELRSFFGGPVDSSAPRGTRGSVLSDSAATRLLDRDCAARYADNFTLYKLYGRAAAFAGG